MAQYTVQGRIKLLYNYDKLSESKSSVQYKLSSNGVVLRFGEICSISLFHTNTRDTRRLGYSRVRVFDSGRKSGPSVTEEGSLSDSDLEEFEEREDDLTSFRGLVLDISCRPVNVVCWKRAICMEFMEKADVLEYYDQTVNSPSGSFYIPAVLRVRQLLQVVKRKRIRNTLSRKNIFYRDGFTCQYCYATANLTIDHVMPIARGGKWEWENLVTACAKCNSRKGQKTPEEANMELIKVPKAPKEYDILAIPLTSAALRKLRVRKGTPKEWLEYLSW